MSSLYKNYVSYVLKGDEVSFNKIVSNVVKFLHKSFIEVNEIDREDLIQEVLELIYIKFKVVDFTVALDLNEESLLNESIKRKLPFNDSLVNDKNLTLYRFFTFNNEQMNIYNTLLKRPSLIKGFKLIFESYIGNAKIISYISKICKYKLYEYNRRKQLVLSLNRTNDNGDEYITLLKDEDVSKFSVDDLYMLTTEELEFLKSFYNEGYLKSQKEVAQDTGITQQGVSKKLGNIKNKIKKVA